MANQQHIIQKLTMEIGLRTQEQAFGIQTKITNEYERLMLRTMCEIFDRLVGENEVVRIDKLEINIGTISSEHLEYELQEKIKKEIEDALTKLLYEVRQSPDGNTEVRIETSGGDAITVQTSVQTRSFSLVGTLIYFLEFGVLPWTEDRKEKPTLRFLVAQAMEKHPEQLRQALYQLKHKDYVFRRLAFQIPEEQLQYLAAILGSGFSSKLIVFHKQLEKWIEQILKFAGEKHKSGKIFTREKLKFFFWEEALRYFSVNHESQQISGSESDRIFISEMLQKIIAFFELTITAEFIKRVKGNYENAFEVSIKKLLKETVETESYKKKTLKSEAEETIEEKKHRQETQIIEEQKKKKQAIEELINPDKKKVKIPEIPEAEDGIYINNAGLVILASYIPAFFRNIGLVNGREFVSEDAKWKGVHLLQWLVFGDRKEEDEKNEISEHDLVLNKLFCGIDIAEPVPVFLQLSEKEKEEGIDLLKAVIENWTIIKRTKVPSLRITFLVKEGKLKRAEKNWHLFIHRDSAVDMLIDKLPWAISMIKFPWNKETLYVEW